MSKGNPRRHHQKHSKRSTGAVITAVLSSECGWCGQSVSPGDRIVNRNGKWQHISCKPPPEKKGGGAKKKRSVTPAPRRKSGPVKVIKAAYRCECGDWLYPGRDHDCKGVSDYQY